ncbi:hypothetical protein [Pseudoduganella violaceinigra]|uniref:hypothetical protein n=1 Tax=Pseudoduganella violaceinigra TaxID=246602 RepID=UPI0006875563|nr:hypothetical protein [Pseudoduganella violaceinigra]
MEGLIGISIPFQVFLDLSAYLDGRRSTEEFAEVAGRAISEWIALQHATPTHDGGSSFGGYQWKTLFLPSGTRLRLTIRKATHHASVEGDCIVYEGAAVTPAQLVNQVAGGTRNAWKHIWLQLPGDTRWQRAESLR